MKFLLCYICSFVFGWLGINSFMVGLAYWEFDGALMPILVGALLCLLAARFIVATVRTYYRSNKKNDQDFGSRFF